MVRSNVEPCACAPVQCGEPPGAALRFYFPEQPQVPQPYCVHILLGLKTLGLDHRDWAENGGPSKDLEKVVL